MPRKDESLLNLLTRLPWQYSVMAAVAAYALFRFVLPAVPVGNPLIRAFVSGVSLAGPLVVILLLAAGLVSFVLSRRGRRLLSRQTGLDSVGGLSWQQFESLVGEVFRRRGYRVLENPGGGADGGVDLRLRVEGGDVDRDRPGVRARQSEGGVRGPGTGGSEGEGDGEARDGGAGSLRG